MSIMKRRTAYDFLALAVSALLGALTVAVVPACQRTPGDVSEETVTDSSTADQQTANLQTDDSSGIDQSQQEAVQESAATDDVSVDSATTDASEKDVQSSDEVVAADETTASEDLSDAQQEDSPTGDTAVTEETTQDIAATSSNDESSDPLAAVDKASNPDIQSGDWAQWGGSTYRNNTPIGTNIPIEWSIGKIDRRTGEWDPTGSENIKYVVRVGSQTYGNTVISKGSLFIGTNNSAGYLSRYASTVDLGCMLSFNEADGQFLWQHSSEKLSTGRVHDWPLQGICCAPLVEGDRLWFVSSRGEVICLDAQGYYDDEDDGPVTSEWGNLLSISVDLAKGLDEGALHADLRSEFARVGYELPEQVEMTTVEAGKSWEMAAELESGRRLFKANVRGSKLIVQFQITIADKHEADTIWSYDMMGELKISQHNMCSCSVTSWGDILFVNTSNGVDESHINIPSIEAPSFIAMNKNTGEVLWTDHSPGSNILHGQWSSPTIGVIQGEPQVIFAGGDGWVYSFRANEGENGKPELLWKFDANPKVSKWILNGRGTRNNIIATPVIYDGLVYVAVGQDPEHGQGIGHLWCIDPTCQGDVSAELAVHVDDRNQTISPRRLIAVEPEKGEIAIDNPNSAVIWHYSEQDQNGDDKIDFEETMHRSCGTVAIKNDILFVADFSGLVHCLHAKTGEVHWTYDMLAESWGSPLIVEDKVYVGDEDGEVCVFNLSTDPHEPIAENDMGNSVYSTPIVANGVMYISNKSHVFAIQSKLNE